MTVEDAIKKITDDLRDTLLTKNRDYGNSVLQPPYLKPDLDIDSAILVRMSDKINRLRNLFQGEQQPEVQESINDTILDLAGYCVMFLVQRQEKDT